MRAPPLPDNEAPEGEQLRERLGPGGARAGLPAQVGLVQIEQVERQLLAVEREQPPRRARVGAAELE